MGGLDHVIVEPVDQSVGVVIGKLGAELLMLDELLKPRHISRQT